MKVLWFTNVPMPAVHNFHKKKVIGSGGWMGALLKNLAYQSNLEIGVVTVCSYYPQSQFKFEGVNYFIIPQQSSKFRPSIFHPDNNKKYLTQCIEVIKHYKPDIIHIHGTERFYGKMINNNEIDCPIVISIQGVLAAYSERYNWFGKLPLIDILKISFKRAFILQGLLWDLYSAKQNAKREQMYFKNGAYFLGRTRWDKAYVTSLNKTATYFHVGEILRESFWEKKWSLTECCKHRLIFTNARHPRKGTEILLAAVGNLKKRYPNIELALIGSLGSGDYKKYLKKKIKKLGKSIKILGMMNGRQIANELCKSHIFISPSYIDNSPNSLAEAQLLGMPVISTYTGGVPSMIKDQETGLFFPTGDLPLLMDNIVKIFENDRLAINLGTQARNIAKQRHNPSTITEKQIEVYETILKTSTSTKPAVTANK